MKRFLVLMLALIGIFSSNATRCWAGSGETAAAFLNMGVGARGEGMGEAYTTEARGVEALYWNPAGLSQKEAPGLFFSHQPIVEKTKYSQVGLAFPLTKGYLGVGYSGLSYPSIDAFDEYGNEADDYSAVDQLCVLGLGFGGENFRWGLSAKYIRQSIDDLSAGTGAADAGITFSNPWVRSLKHAVVVANVGGTISLLDEKEDLPMKVVIGNALKISRRIRATFDYSYIKGTGRVLAGGCEWAVVNGKQNQFALRGGYTTRRNEIDQVSGASFGAGLYLGRLLFDYAWVPYGELGNSHVISISLKFAPESNKPRARTPKPTSGPKTLSDLSESSDIGSRILLIMNNGETIDGILLMEKEDRFLIKTQGRKEQIFKTDILKFRKIE